MSYTWMVEEVKEKFDIIFFSHSTNKIYFMRTHESLTVALRLELVQHTLRLVKYHFSFPSNYTFIFEQICIESPTSVAKRLQITSIEPGHTMENVFKHTSATCEVIKRAPSIPCITWYLNNNTSRDLLSLASEIWGKIVCARDNFSSNSSHRSASISVNKTRRGKQKLSRLDYVESQFGNFQRVHWLFTLSADEWECLRQIQKRIPLECQFDGRLDVCENHLKVCQLFSLSLTLSPFLKF